MMRGAGNRRSSAIVVAGAVALAVGLANCANSIDIGYQDDAGTPEAGPGILRGPEGDDSGVVSSVDAAVCVATDCPWPWVTCISADGTLPAYACSTNVASDLLNCGGCGVMCEWGPATYHLYPSCIDGQCKTACSQGYYDCNAIPDDGCEVQLSADPNNCGACGNKCPAGVACIEAQCGCPPGRTYCGDKCVDLETDDANCGQCAFSCRDHQPTDGGTPPPNMIYGCKSGQCTDLRCYQDRGIEWTDCNNSIHPDGCEINLAQPDTNNCGKCGNTCVPGEKCFSRAETGMACQCRDGTTYCPAVFPSTPQSCADLENDPKNCGSCGYTCPFVQNAAPTCTHGRCGFKCNEGLADCNGSAIDGCEVALSSDPLHCGSCGTSCDVAAGQPCVAGQCPMRDCDAGLTR